jgi:hypothetical protein
MAARSKTDRTVRIEVHLVRPMIVVFMDNVLQASPIDDNSQLGA